MLEGQQQRVSEDGPHRHWSLLTLSEGKGYRSSSVVLVKGKQKRQLLGQKTEALGQCGHGEQGGRRRS